MESITLTSIVASKFPFDLLKRFDVSTSYLKLSFKSDGTVSHFKGLPGGKDHLAALAVPASFMSIRDKAGSVFNSTSISRTESMLRVEFGSSSVTAKVHVREWPSYLTFELIAIDDHTISSITLLDLPLTLTELVSSTLASCRDAGYAAAAVPLNIQTHSRATPIKGSAHATLMVEADSRVRLEGVKFALVGCPPADLLRIVEQIEKENALPHPTLGGAWARLAPEQKRSYLFIDIQDDGKATAAAIQYAHDGGFGCVVLRADAWAETYGTYKEKLKLPLESVSKQIHKAGLRLGLHMMDLVVSKNDPLVQPIPQDGFLMYPAFETVLAKDMDEHVKTIETTEAPTKLLRAHDFDTYRGRDLRIDDEIISYEDTRVDAASGAVGFLGCKRHETKNAPHKKGAVIHNFAEFVGHYLPDVRHPLFDKVAKAAATVLNKHKIDYVYPDGIGENVAEWPPIIPVWYAGNLALFGLFENVSREMIFAHFPTSDYAWHVFSQGNTTDYATRGLLTHFDVESLKSAEDPSEMQPFELGWFGYFKYSKDAASTRPRELNYAWAKAAGYEAAMSLETNQDDLAVNGRTKENLTIIKAWEHLKLGGAISAGLRSKLRERGKEFVIETLPLPFVLADIAVVTPVDYDSIRYIAQVDEVHNVWTFDNPNDYQPLRLSLDVNPTFAAYGAAGGQTLFDPDKPIEPRLEGNGPLRKSERGSPGSRLLLTKSADTAPGGIASARAQFTNSIPADKATPASEWACVQLVLDDDKGLDLTGRRGLGTHVKGDKSDAILHFILEDVTQQVRDYYVPLNFTGWKYVPMLEAAGSEVYDFHYVYSNYYAIRKLDFGSIRRMYVIISNVGKGGTVDCQFSRVEALEESALPVRNPGLLINGVSTVFPVEINSEGYMEFDGVGTGRVFDKDGNLLTNVAPKGIPKVKSGKNSARFFCDIASGLGQSVKVSLITHGSPLT